MKDDNSNLLTFGLIIGGLLGAGIAVYLGSILINKNKQRRERNHKFFEGIEDIFDSKPSDAIDEDTSIDKETEKGIIEELFSRTN